VTEEAVEALSELLTLDNPATSFSETEIPEALLGSRFVESEVRAPSVCPDRLCREHCTVVERKESHLKIECDDGHESEIPISEQTFHDVDYREVLDLVSEISQLDLTEVSSELPRYIHGSTEQGVNIYLVVDPSDYHGTVNEICVDTLSTDSPALLISPGEEIKNLLDHKALFSSGNLIYSVPFSLLEKEQEIRRSLTTIEDIQEVERGLLDRFEDDDGLVRKVNSNPRYILTELNHMRLMRLAGELPQHSGTRLEKVAESAFGHLFATKMDAGGEDDRGKNLPDSVFYVSADVLPEGYDSIIGVADEKSGKDAGFGDESVEGKHENYVKEARDQSVAADKIAHTFVVLDFDGHQDIDFFDRMSEVYEDGEHMVVFTAEALAMILSAYLSYTVSNELSLVKGNFQTVIYPLFDPERFNDPDLGLSEKVREAGDQEAYSEEYRKRSDLLIVTTEVVEKLIKHYSDSPQEVGRIFEVYLKPRVPI
jgi:hypothetical protein